MDLRRFWLGRARRLLPALFAVLVATALYCVLFLPGEVAGLRGDVLAALTYSTNWYLVLSEQSYFEAIGRPSLLRHLWSLAIEEQFYLLWPLVLAGVLALTSKLSGGGAGRSPGGARMSRRLIALAVATGALTVASAVLAASLYEPGVDPSRIYYGADTRASALLVGALLALLWHPARMRRSLPEGGGDTTGHPVLALSGLAALAALVLLCFTIRESGPFLYNGGFLLTSLASATLIAVLASPHRTLVGGLLALPALRWLGRRSYGIYLWHWPVYMVSRPGIDVGLQGITAFGLRVAATLALAALSYKFIEMPVRRGAPGRLIERCRSRQDPARGVSRLRVAAMCAPLALLLAALGTAMMAAEDPGRPEYLSKTSVNTAGEVTAGASKEESGGSIAAAELSDARPARTEKGTRSTGEAGAENGGARESARDVPARSEGDIDTGAGNGEATGDDATYASGAVTAVGDSVLVGAAEELTREVEGEGGTLGVSARVGLQADQAAAIVEDLSSGSGIGDALVLHIGNNGTVSGPQLDRIIHSAREGGAERIVLVNDKVPRSWEASNNETLAAAARGEPDVTLADWRGASLEHPEYFYDDGIHLTPSGQQAYNQLVLQSLKK